MLIVSRNQQGRVRCYKLSRGDVFLRVRWVGVAFGTWCGAGSAGTGAKGVLKTGIQGEGPSRDRESTLLLSRNDVRVSLPVSN